MFFRLKILLAVLGGMLAYFGYQEFVVSQKATAPATPVELAQLEQTTDLSNYYITLDEHISVYAGCIYSYERDRYETGEPGPGATVNYTYYPIISASHPFVQQMLALRQEYGDADIPESRIPAFGHFSVLVKSHRFKTVKDIPDGMPWEGELTGLIINKINTLDADEHSLLTESFPQLDLDRVLIVEEGREPSSWVKSFGMMGGGTVVCFLGVGLFFIPARK